MAPKFVEGVGPVLSRPKFLVARGAGGWYWGSGKGKLRDRICSWCRRSCCRLYDPDQDALAPCPCLDDGAFSLSSTSTSGSEPEHSTMPESLLWSEIPILRSSQKAWLWSADAFRCAVRAVVCKVLIPFSMHWKECQMSSITACKTRTYLGFNDVPALTEAGSKNLPHLFSAGKILASEELELLVVPIVNMTAFNQPLVAFPASVGSLVWEVLARNRLPVESRCTSTE